MQKRRLWIAVAALLIGFLVWFYTPREVRCRVKPQSLSWTWSGGAGCSAPTAFTAG